jgi:hypothetical protein
MSWLLLFLPDHYGSLRKFFAYICKVFIHLRCLMKSIASLVLLVLFVSSTVFAQNSDEVTLSKSRGTKVGVGIAIAPGGTFLLTDDDGLISFIPLLLRVPVNLSNVKIEPELGVYNFNVRQEAGPSFDENSGTLLRFGAGLFYNAAVSSDASVYVGPKVGLMSISSTREFSNSSGSSQSSKTETSQTNIFFGAMVGGEYFFSSHFSIGAEAGLEYISKGDEDRTTTPADPDPTPTPETVTSGSEIHTKAALTARFYF